MTVHVAAMDIRERLARNLRLLRQEKGWSQEAFADEAGLHRTYISDLERGARNPTITVVDKLAIALGVTPGRLHDSGPDLPHATVFRCKPRFRATEPPPGQPGVG